MKLFFVVALVPMLLSQFSLAGDWREVKVPCDPDIRRFVKFQTVESAGEARVDPATSPIMVFDQTYAGVYWFYKVAFRDEQSLKQFKSFYEQRRGRYWDYWDYADFTYCGESNTALDREPLSMFGLKIIIDENSDVDIKGTIRQMDPSFPST